MAELWVSYPELERAIGHDAAQTLCRVHGGVPVYVPYPDARGTGLEKIIGPGPTRALASFYGGGYITVPNHRRQEPLKPRVVAGIEAKRHYRDIALEVGVTERYVRSIARQMGMRKSYQLTLF